MARPFTATTAARRGRHRPLANVRGLRLSIVDVQIGNAVAGAPQRHLRQASEGVTLAQPARQLFQQRLIRATSSARRRRTSALALRRGVRRSTAPRTTRSAPKPRDGNVIAANGVSAPALPRRHRAAARQQPPRATRSTRTPVGIDIFGDGVTANDAGDPDAGPNNLRLTVITPPRGRHATYGTLNRRPRNHGSASILRLPACDQTGNARARASSARPPAHDASATRLQHDARRGHRAGRGHHRAASTS